MYQLICTDSVNGILSGIYEAWAGRYPRHEVVLQAGEIKNYELFTEYVHIQEEIENAEKVKRTIHRRFGQETWEAVCYAIWSNQEDKANAVYQMILCGIEKQMGKNLHQHLTNPYIQRVFELNRMVFNEAHHYLGFLRFSELEKGILYAQIEPKYYIIEQLADHFSDRLPMENWLIYDVSHQIVAAHQKGSEWLLFQDTLVADDTGACISKEEEHYRELWKTFCRKISINERENIILQRQNMPLRFRNHMVEFNE